MDLIELKTLLRAHYAVSDPAPQPLPNSWEGRVYLVAQPDGGKWVVRTLDAAEAAGDVQVLAWLDRRGYPAPRLVRTSDGLTSVSHSPESILVTTFIEGELAGFSPSTLYRLGALLGRLHSLDLDMAPVLPPAGMLPASDMATALDWLRPLRPLASAKLVETHDRLLEAIQELDSGGHLPRTLIHNDAHPGNAIVTPEGEAVFIDWHGAGLGPPMVDLGFLLISTAIGPSWATPIPPGEGRLEAIVDGYAAHRIPTQAELEWLPHAIRFRGLLYGAGHLAATAKAALDSVTETWWWDRHLAAVPLAERVCERFARYS